MRGPTRSSSSRAARAPIRSAYVENAGERARTPKYVSASPAPRSSGVSGKHGEPGTDDCAYAGIGADSTPSAAGTPALPSPSLMRGQRARNHAIIVRVRASAGAPPNSGPANMRATSSAGRPFAGESGICEKKERRYASRLPCAVGRRRRSVRAIAICEVSSA